jgi:hypothetical protein
MLLLVVFPLSDRDQLGFSTFLILEPTFNNHQIVQIKDA